jgi:glutathione peroxidase
MRNPTPRSLAIAAAIFVLPVGAALAPDGAIAEETTKELLDLSARRLGGSEEPLSHYRGEVLLIVNTASECGYTPQYAGLQTLYERYRDKKFQVLGFPSNDFGEQEPGDDRQIGAFCKSNYGVEFPMFTKVRVLGAEAHPVYAYLTSLPKPIGGPVEWNFQKYLVDRNGVVVARFESDTEPDDPALVATVERLLSEPTNSTKSEPPSATKSEPPGATKSESDTPS